MDSWKCTTTSSWCGSESWQGWGAAEVGTVARVWGAGNGQKGRTERNGGFIFW